MSKALVNVKRGFVAEVGREAIVVPNGMGLAGNSKRTVTSVWSAPASAGRDHHAGRAGLGREC